SVSNRCPSCHVCHSDAAASATWAGCINQSPLPDASSASCPSHQRYTGGCLLRQAVWDIILRNARHGGRERDRIGPCITCVEELLALHTRSCTVTRRVGCMRLLGSAAEAGGSVLRAGFTVAQSGLRSFHLV